MTDITKDITPLPYTPIKAASAYHKARPDMLDWCAYANAYAPFREGEDCDKPGELVEEQTVLIAHGKTPEQAINTIDFVCRASNSYQPMLEALEKCRLLLQDEGLTGDEYDAADYAIALAKGEMSQ